MKKMHCRYPLDIAHRISDWEVMYNNVSENEAPYEILSFLLLKFNNDKKSKKRVKTHLEANASIISSLRCKYFINVNGLRTIKATYGPSYTSSSTSTWIGT